MSGFPMISFLTFLPLVGALLLLGLEESRQQFARSLALLFSLLTLGGALVLWNSFDATKGGMQFVEKHDWVPSLAMQYNVGIDGLGLLMILLTTLLVPISILASSRISGKASSYFSLMLMLECGLLGTFTALNFCHWFIFWELGLIPAFFLIKLWGGNRSSAAATQFFVYTMVGSVAMLLAFLGMYLAVRTFDFQQLADLGRSGELAKKLDWVLNKHALPRDFFPMLIFGGVLLGFAVKVPLIPFHTWLPEAYSQAPTSVTMLLTGLMSKMGVYGLLRILLPIFPDQMRAMLTPLLWLAVATIVLSACAAFAQRDLKKVFAYSSINHLGYCMLGIFAVASLTGNEEASKVEKVAALSGVILQMFNHGLTASILFCFIGLIEQRSGGLRGMGDFGGLRKVAPVFCGLMGIAIFASLGLPGLNGFVGEFLIFKGAFPLATWATSLSVIGLLVTAIFLLTVLQRVFSGPLNEKWSGFPDLTVGERFLVVPALVLMLIIGIFPQLLIGKINATVVQMVAQLVN